MESTVLKMTGRGTADLVTPPRAGLDFAAVKVGRKFLVISADPVTGVTENIGRYAVHVSANDVATSGNRPQFLESVVLLPEGAGDVLLREIADQMHETASSLGITIVGGHTEVTPGLDRPIVATTVFSLVEKFVTSGGGKPGDLILMTKTAGLEGTAVLAGRKGLLHRGVSKVSIENGRKYLGRISVVDEAVAAFETGMVHGMHDCTEGGVLGAMFEMSLASGVGFELYEGRVPVAKETKEICSSLGIDPIRLLGSGSLLISVPAREARGVRRSVEGITEVTEVGRFTSGGRSLLRNGRRVNVGKAPEDELWRTLGRLG